MSTITADGCSSVVSSGKAAAGVPGLVIHEFHRSSCVALEIYVGTR